MRKRWARISLAVAGFVFSNGLIFVAPAAAEPAPPAAKLAGLKATTATFPVTVQSGDGSVVIPSRPGPESSPFCQRHPDVVRNGGR